MDIWTHSALNLAPKELKRLNAYRHNFLQVVTIADLCDATGRFITSNIFKGNRHTDRWTENITGSLGIMAENTGPDNKYPYWETSYSTGELVVKTYTPALDFSLGYDKTSLSWTDGRRLISNLLARSYSPNLSLQIKSIVHIRSGVLYDNWHRIFLCMIHILLFVLQVHTLYMNIW